MSKKHQVNFDNAYTGRNYSNESILKILKKFKINYSKADEKLIAKYISQGKVIGRCAGKSEYGPIFLPSTEVFWQTRGTPKMRNYLNKNVKHREMFRPFCTSYFRGKNSEYFDLNQPSPYMLLVAKSQRKINSISNTC